MDKETFCNSIKNGDIITPTPGGWLAREYDITRVLVIGVTVREGSTPLLDIVTQKLVRKSFDSAHFYVEPPKPEIVEMTVADVSKLVGKPVKIVE